VSVHPDQQPGSPARDADWHRAVFRVLERNLPALRAEVGRLARRAERLGTAPLAVHETGRRDGRHVLVTLEGEPPALAGWRVAAVVDHRGSVPAVRVVSSAAPPLDPERFREPRCEHCRRRLRRVETFVLWHAATRRVRQVGTACLRDFLGGDDPERLCRQAEYVLLARQSLRDAARPPRLTGDATAGVALERFAEHAAMALRAGGWVSRERARRSGRLASADAALRSLETVPDAPGPADTALARGALLWARELLAAQARLSRFERDAVTVVSVRRLLTARERGLVCALVAVYRGRRAGSRHLGRPGEWLDTVVVVERTAERPSTRHGTVRRHDLIDVAGNRLVWWQTRGAPLALGQAVHLRGRVDRHTHLRGAQLTVLARCRPLDRRAR
jgi:hypothetical protein